MRRLRRMLSVAGKQAAITHETWAVLTLTTAGSVRRYTYPMAGEDQLIDFGVTTRRGPYASPLVFAVVQKPDGERSVFCVDVGAAHDAAGESAVVMRLVDPELHAYWRDAHGLPVAQKEANT